MVSLSKTSRGSINGQPVTFTYVQEGEEHVLEWKGVESEQTSDDLMKNSLQGTLKSSTIICIIKNDLRGTIEGEGDEYTILTIEHPDLNPPTTL